MPVTFAFVTVMVESTAVEINAVFSFEAAMPVFIVYPVAIVAMPAGV